MNRAIETLMACVGAALFAPATIACGVSRDPEYFQLLGQFRKAESRSAVAQGMFTPAYQFPVPLPGSEVTA